VEDAIAAIFVIVGIVGGLGLVGVATAWLNDRRQAAIERRSPPLDPKEILERRFALGEIDETEFNRRMHRLTYGPPLELD
jgi:uncharacterized membrane protein